MLTKKNCLLFMVQDYECDKIEESKHHHNVNFLYFGRELETSSLSFVSLDHAHNLFFVEGVPYS